MADINVQPEKEFEERIIEVNRVSKKYTGGNRISFSVLMAVGDKRGKVGASLGKAPDVTSAIKKALVKAKKNMIEVPMVGETIPHEMESKFGASRILLKPAPPGAGIIAGGSVRTILELAGVKDVSAKMIGSNNKITNVYNVLNMLNSFNARLDKKSEGKGKSAGNK